MIAEVLLAAIVSMTPVPTMPSETMQVDEGVQVEYPYTDNSSCKKWMDYRCITDTASEHYKLLHGENVIHEQGGLINVDGYYAVALGQSFGEVGDKFRITLQDARGTHAVNVIMCDAKQAQHTRDCAGWMGQDGHILEVIVNTDCLDSEVMQMGDANYHDTFAGEITKIERLD